MNDFVAALQTWSAHTWLRICERSFGDRAQTIALSVPAVKQSGSAQSALESPSLSRPSKQRSSCTGTQMPQLTLQLPRMKSLFLVHCPCLAHFGHDMELSAQELATALLLPLSCRMATTAAATLAPSAPGNADMTGAHDFMSSSVFASHGSSTFRPFWS